MSICFHFEPVHARIRHAALLTCSRLVRVILGICVAGNLFAQMPAHAATDVSMNRANDLYLTGLALVKQGKLDQAIAVFQRALQSDPQNRLCLDAIGGAYSLKGGLEQARQYFLKCLEQDPAFSPARKNLAITYFSEGQYDLAADEFQKLKDSAPRFIPIANLFLGIIAERNSNPIKAATLLEDSGELLHQYPEAILSLAHAELQLAHPENAQELLANFEAAHGITPPQFAQALTLLKDLATKSPNGEVLNLLAHMAQRCGDLELALESLRHAAKLQPDREDNYLDFSTICADYGNYPLALEAADVGLDHIPNSYKLSVQKGVVLENLARFEEAEKTLREAAELQKDNSVALLSLAIVQTHAGHLRDAETTLTSALKEFPDNFYMYYQLGKVLLPLQQLSPNDAELTVRAKEAFQQAIRHNSSFADSYYQLSKLYLPQSPNLAEQNLRKCLQADPNHAPAEYALARLYLSSGRRAAGQALIDQFERQQQAEKVKDNQKPRIEVAQK